MKKLIIVFIIGITALPLLRAQEKETPPPGGEPKGFTLPNKQTFVLENGLTGVMVPWGSIPKAQIQIVIKTGNVHEGENETYLCDLVGDLM